LHKSLKPLPNPPLKGRENSLPREKSERMKNHQKTRVAVSRSGQYGVRKNTPQQPDAKTANSEGLSRRPETTIPVVADAIAGALRGDEWMLWV
jgi:hypothetical protein